MAMKEVPGTEFKIPADLVLLAMGLSPGPRGPGRRARRRARCARQRRAATERGLLPHVAWPKVFAAGDMRRGQSLVVWAIREGREAAREVDAFLMGHSDLPR